MYHSNRISEFYFQALEKKMTQVIRLLSFSKIIHLIMDLLENSLIILEFTAVVNYSGKWKGKFY